MQNKGIRIYLGVHRFALSAAVSCDMGWIHCSVRRKVCMIRFWNRIVRLDNSKLPRKLLEWVINCKGNTKCKSQQWKTDSYDLDGPEILMNELFLHYLG